MSHTHNTTDAPRAAGEALSCQGAEKVYCPECRGSGDTSVHAAIHHGEHRCTDCNGKGFNWEPIEESASTPLVQQQDLP